MAQIGPELNVDAPPRMPGMNGLFPALRALDFLKVNVSQREEMGFVHRPEGCGPAGIFLPCSDDIKEASVQPENVTNIPYLVWADDDCSTWGYDEYDFEERKARAEANLDAQISNIVGNELWTGAAAAAALPVPLPNPSFAGNATQLSTPGGAGSPYVLALGQLQAYLANCLGDGTVGIIYATHAVVTLWWSTGAISCGKDGVLRDIYGNVVIASGGFDGSDPLGNIDPYTPWAYATGSLIVRLGPVRYVGENVRQTMNRATNNITVFAERTASTQFDTCCVFGIGVDICNACCGALDPGPIA